MCLTARVEPACTKEGECGYESQDQFVAHLRPLASRLGQDIPNRRIAKRLLLE